MSVHIDGHCFIADEKNIGDSIFSMGKPGSNILAAQTSRGNDMASGMPVISRWFFTNIKTPDLFCIDGNNMVFPVEYRNNLSRANPSFNAMFTAKQETTGIFIVTVYRFKAQANKDNNVFEYYSGTMNTIWDKSIDTEVNHSLLRNYKPYSNERTVRVVVFIPESSIGKNTIFTECKTGLTFTRGLPIQPHKAVPYTAGSINLEKHDMQRCFLVKIEIVSHDDRSYYMAVGDTVHKILPVKSLAKRPGVYMHTVLNGTVFDEYASLENASELGVYNTMDEALYQTPGKKVELEIANKKLEQSKLDAELHSEKTEQARRAESIKHRNEVIKSTLTIASQLITIGLLIYKSWPDKSTKEKK